MPLIMISLCSEKRPRDMISSCFGTWLITFISAPRFQLIEFILVIAILKYIPFLTSFQQSVCHLCVSVCQELLCNRGSINVDPRSSLRLLCFRYTVQIKLTFVQNKSRDILVPPVIVQWRTVYMVVSHPQHSFSGDQFIRSVLHLFCKSSCSVNITIGWRH